MNAGSAGPPSKDVAGAPAEIGTYLQYARENVETSRMLFENGKVRHAVFFANEGLELCVKAHMLHYKIIDKAIAAGHFPYRAAVKRMIEITESNRNKNPSNKYLEQALGLLGTLEGAFNMFRDKKLITAMWKLSLNIGLVGDEKNRVEAFRKTLDNWGSKTVQIRDKQRQAVKQSYEKLPPDKQAEFFATVFESNAEKPGQSMDTRLSPLTTNIKPPYDCAPDVDQMCALVELIIHINIIVCSSAHQQISRYPTLIDGVDSQRIYMDHIGDVKELLDQIYSATDILLEELECGAPLLAQRMIASSGDLRKILDGDQNSRLQVGSDVANDDA